MARRRKEDGRPLGGRIAYKMVHDLLWRMIANLAPGQRFNSREIAQQAGVDEKTVRKHLWEFVAERKLDAVDQEGRFVVFQKV